MEHEQVVKVMRSAKGRFVKVITETAPVSPAEMARRIAKAAASVAPDAKAAIPMVKTLSTRTDERGWTISVVQIVGQLDKHYGEDGFHIGKDGGLSFSLVGGAQKKTASLRRVRTLAKRVRRASCAASDTRTAR